MADTDAPDLEKQLIPLETASTTAGLAVSLVFKLLANLRKLDKLDDEELQAVATSLIAELPSEHERFEMRELLGQWLPDVAWSDEEED